MPKIIIDLDNTLCTTINSDYENSEPVPAIIDSIREAKDNGFEVIIHTARNMRAFSGDISKINQHTLPIILKWMNKHNIPFDGIIVGKPWCGKDGFYVDDRAIRPSEFKAGITKVYEILKNEEEFIDEQTKGIQ